MKQQNDKEKPRRLYLIVAGIAVAALAVLNYFYFREKISSNAELITRYTRKADPMEKYRNPAVAGLFYAAAPQMLEREVEHYLQSDYYRHDKMPKILVVPHAGYQYSAPAAAEAYKPLRDYAGEIKRVILVGPSHRVAVNGAALSSVDYFMTPLGRIAVDGDAVKQLASSPLFVIDDSAHKDEHSLEVQLPFLQKVLSDFKIVPIVYGEVNPQELAEALEPYLRRRDTLLVVSADLSHYLSYEQAQVIDRQTAEQIAAGTPQIDEHRSCGAAGINTALILSQAMHLQPRILALINSGDTSGERSRVVGYGAWSFSAASALERETAALKDFAAVNGKSLLRIARTSLEEAVLHRRLYTPSRQDYDDMLFDKGASFVTLEEKGELRGCIGSLLPRRAVAADVAENAYNAALSDSRFKAVTADELEKIDVSVSLLTGYEPISYNDEADLLNLLQPDIDGIVIRDGDRQALFLPSVWKTLPDRVEFLNSLKLKAGMSPSYWSNSIKVYRFRTVEVKENAN